MVGAAGAVLAQRAAKLAEHDDDRVPEAVAQALRQGVQARAKDGQTVRQSSFRAALVGMGVPATDRGECQLRVRVLAQQQSQPPGIGGEAARRGRAVVGTGVHALGFVTGHAAAHLAAAFAGGLVGSGQLDVFGVELFQCRLHPGVVDGLGF